MRDAYNKIQVTVIKQKYNLTNQICCCMLLEVTVIWRMKKAVTGRKHVRCIFRELLAGVKQQCSICILALEPYFQKG